MNEEIKQKLDAELAQVREELETIAEFNQTTGDWEAMLTHAPEADENTVADNAEEAVERQGLVAALETRFRNITRALDKLDAGTYGICEVCHNPIEPERSSANFAARTCIADRNKEDTLSL